jgi:phasin family protein
MSSPAIEYSGDGGYAGHEAFASLADMANQTFDGFERLARLNLQTMKTTLAEQHGIALEAIDTRSFDWMLTLPTAAAQAGLKKTLAYWQHFHAIAVETASNNVGAGWEGFTQCSRWFEAALSDAARTRAGAPLVLTAPDESLPLSTQADAGGAVGMAGVTKAGGKKRSVDIVDSSGNVVSSVKQ